MLEKLQALPESINQPEQFLADAGYFSEANVDACEEAGIEPLIAVKHAEHYPHWSERSSEPPKALPETTAFKCTANRPKIGTGRGAYALRKQTVEPVFGIVESIMGPHPRTGQRPGRIDPGVPLAWNPKRMAVLRLQ